VSRNFELLRRVEDECQRTQAGRAPFKSSEPGPESPGLVFSSERPFASEQLGATLPALARDELVKLIQRLFLLRASGAPRVVVLFGLETQNGSSFISTCASEVLAAHVDGSVCLVDANLRNPGIHEHLGIANHYGFTDAVLSSGPLSGFTKQLSRNLWLLTCGSPAADINGLFASERLRKRFQELRTEFDYVLVETAGGTLYNEAIVLGRLADGVVLVIEAHATRREVAENVKANLVHADVRVLGTVLNNRTFPIPQTLYSKL
jgi:Mrp family chromosome partitioning ATPase